jgi:hypothetical protein
MLSRAPVCSDVCADVNLQMARTPHISDNVRDLQFDVPYSNVDTGLQVSVK